MSLTIRSKAPTFTLPNQDNNNVTLDQFSGKYVVLYFYPKDNTPGCTIEAIDFSKNKDEFTKLNTVILGVSADSVQSHCKFIQKRDLTITLLSDQDKETLKAYGAWGKKEFMGKEYDGVIRSTVLINKEGNIAHIWSPVSVKGHVEAVLDKIKELS
jgi:thioredoxin-dependent peroxiredoxin